MDVCVILHQAMEGAAGINVAVVVAEGSQIKLMVAMLAGQA